MIKQKLAEIEKILEETKAKFYKCSTCGKERDYEGKCNICGKQSSHIIYRYNKYLQAKKEGIIECEKIIKEEKIKMIDDELGFLKYSYEDIAFVCRDQVRVNDCRNCDKKLRKLAKKTSERLSQLQKLREDLV